jgi:hypothetical protein
VRIATLSLVLVGLLGCASPAPGPIEYRDAVTADGLHQVRTSRVAGAYVKPGARLGSYSKIRIAPVTVAYKRPPRSAQRSYGSLHGNYALSDEAMARFEGLFQEAFEKQFAASESFSLVDEPGADVLEVQGRIVDLIVEVPPEPTGRSRAYAKQAGAMTLILDVRDSLTDEPLARFADRRVVSNTAGFHLSRQTTTSTTAELRRTFGRWARLLRDALDSLHALPEIPLPEADA